MRPAFDALFAIDDAMGEVVASASQSALGAIKLAWWREALEKLDNSPAPAEPRLQAVATELLPKGVSGAELARLEEGWLALLADAPDAQAIHSRGVLLFKIAARLLGGEGAELASPGAAWAQADLARRGCGALPEIAPKLSAARAVRPLTGLAALANRDIRRGDTLEPEATPARAWTLLRHRITGR